MKPVRLTAKDVGALHDVLTTAGLTIRVDRIVSHGHVKTMSMQPFTTFDLSSEEQHAVQKILDACPGPKEPYPGRPLTFWQQLMHRR